MSTIKNNQIALYFHFKKIIKTPPEASFQSPPLNQKHVRAFCYTAHQYLTKLHIDSTLIDSKKNKHKRNFHYVGMPMMKSQILKCLDSTETQESRYLKKET